MRARLAANGRERQAATDAINRYELASNLKIIRDKEAAERDVIARIQEMNIQAIAVERDRRLAEIAFDVAQERYRLTQIFGENADTHRLVDEYKRALVAQFNTWELGERREFLENVKQLELAMMREVAEQMASGGGNFIGRQTQSATDILETRSELAKRFKNPLTGIQDGGVEGIERIDRMADKLRELNLTIHEVDDLFGSASTSAAQFETRLGLIAEKNTSVIETFRQLIDWQQVLVQMFGLVTDAIAGAIAGTDNLGQKLLASFLSAIAQIASTLGSLFLLAAAGFIWIPGLNWSGKQLFIAGAAMLAFAGVVQGLAARLQNQDQQTATGSAATSSGGGGGVGARRPTPSTTIDIGSQSVRAADVTALDATIGRLRQLENSLWGGPVGRIVERLEFEQAMRQRSGFSGQNTTVVIQGKEAASLILDVLEDKGVVTVRGLADSPRARNRGQLRHVMKNVVYDIGSRYGKQW
jgi:hypothetical protein